jgi:hypothetical protein
LDTVQNERRDLKEKLRQTTKKTLFDNILSRQSSDFTNNKNDLTSPSKTPTKSSNTTANGPLNNASTELLYQEVIYFNLK